MKLINDVIVPENECCRTYIHQEHIRLQVNQMNSNIKAEMHGDHYVEHLFNWLDYQILWTVEHYLDMIQLKANFWLSKTSYCFNIVGLIILQSFYGLKK